MLYTLLCYVLLCLRSFVYYNINILQTISFKDIIALIVMVNIIRYGKHESPSGSYFHRVITFNTNHSS